MRMKKVIRLLLWLIACAALAFSAVKLFGYIREGSQSTSLNDRLIDDAVALKETASQTGGASPIEVDFDTLLKKNGDIVGWLYCEDTPINLPVVQSSDNDHYLRRLLDGSWNTAGTLFVDCLNAADFSDVNTVIYGHNMKNKTMFGTLSYYREQSYFEEHPVMWLLTPNGDYKVELAAGYVTPTTSDVYSFDQSEEEVLATVRQAVEGSTFTSGIEISDGDRFLTLSTCSYEYNNARYVLIGRLVPQE